MVNSVKWLDGNNKSVGSGNRLNYYFSELLKNVDDVM